VQGKVNKGGLKKDPDVFEWVPVEYDEWREEVAQDNAAKVDGAGQDPPPSPCLPESSAPSEAPSGWNQQSDKPQDKIKALFKRFASQGNGSNGAGHVMGLQRLLSCNCKMPSS
jgi:hypothetical protein